MLAFTLSSDCHALLCELQLQRAASTRYLQDTLYAPGAPGRALLDTLDQLQQWGLVRQRTEQQWSLTAEGTLTLILAPPAVETKVRSSAMPAWLTAATVSPPPATAIRAPEVVRDRNCLV